jgi:uncharacterized membrane protein YphA (DoxX/SURF4 family)
MWQSLRISHLFLRLSLAGVFLWFGLDKFFDPGYWLNAWVPASVVHIAALFHISGNLLVYAFGVLELLIGISLASNMFVELFALLGAVFLITISFFYGFNEIVVRDIGLIGGLFALSFWPNQRFRNF